MVLFYLFTIHSTYCVLDNRCRGDGVDKTLSTPKKPVFYIILQSLSLHWKVVS